MSEQSAELDTVQTKRKINMPGTKRKNRAPPPSEPPSEPPLPPKRGRGRPRKIKEPPTPKVVKPRNEAYYTDDKFDTKKYCEVNKQKMHDRAATMLLCSCSMWIRRDHMTGHLKKSKHEKLLKMLENM